MDSTPEIREREREKKSISFINGTRDYLVE